jgi:hypothetical protein
VSALVSQAIDAIATNTYYVIEGTGSYTGVPGVYSNADELRGAGLTITATGGSGKTGIVDSAKSYASDKWVKTRAPSFWALCLTATNAANVDAARKITAWTQSSTMLTCTAFPANITAGDTFKILEGFRGVVDGGGEDTDGDRRFTVELEPGEISDIHGAGTRTAKGELVVTVRFADTNRQVSQMRCAVDNAEILRNAIADRSHWETNYTRAIFVEGSKISIDAEGVTTVKVSLPIVYRYNLGFV